MHEFCIFSRAFAQYTTPSCSDMRSTRQTVYEKGVLHGRGNGWTCEICKGPVQSCAHVRQAQPKVQYAGLRGRKKSKPQAGWRVYPQEDARQSHGKLLTTFSEICGLLVAIMDEGGPESPLPGFCARPDQKPVCAEPPCCCWSTYGGVARPELASPVSYEAGAESFSGRDSPLETRSSRGN